MPKGIYNRKVRIPIILIGPSIAHVPLTNGLFALIDSEDVERVSISNWNASWHSKMKVYYAKRGGFSGREAYLARFIKSASPDDTIDHVQSDRTLDNRKANLRKSSQSQNCCNRKIRSDNTSGYRGVCWHSRDKYFSASVMFEGKVRTKSKFLTAEDAAHWRNEHAVDMHGEFARTE